MSVYAHNRSRGELRQISRADIHSANVSNAIGRRRTFENAAHLLSVSSIGHGSCTANDCEYPDHPSG